VGSGYLVTTEISRPVIVANHHPFNKGVTMKENIQVKDWYETPAEPTCAKCKGPSLLTIEWTQGEISWKVSYCKQHVTEVLPPME
jgi:hypothetical protein